MKQNLNQNKGFILATTIIFITLISINLSFILKETNIQQSILHNYYSTIKQRQSALTALEIIKAKTNTYFHKLLITQTEQILCLNKNGYLVACPANFLYDFKVEVKLNFYNSNPNYLYKDINDINWHILDIIIRILQNTEQKQEYRINLAIDNNNYNNNKIINLLNN